MDGGVIGTSKSFNLEFSIQRSEKKTFLSQQNAKLFLRRGGLGTLKMYEFSQRVVELESS